jgi:hypothetical protein
MVFMVFVFRPDDERPPARANRRLLLSEIPLVSSMPFDRHGLL